MNYSVNIQATMLVYELGGQAILIFLCEVRSARFRASGYFMT